MLQVNYMPPELMKTGKVTKAADVYAFGAHFAPVSLNFSRTNSGSDRDCLLLCCLGRQMEQSLR